MVTFDKIFEFILQCIVFDIVLSLSFDFLNRIEVDDKFKTKGTSKWNWRKILTIFFDN